MEKKRESPQFDRQLIERFASGNGTIFVGAGISMQSQLPSWAELMQPLKRELGNQIPQSANYLDIAELYEAAHSRSDLIRYLKTELGHDRYRLSRTHELIVSLPVQRIYTTNFDDLLEQAARRKGINRNVIHDASHVGFSDTSTLSIVKLHGDLGAPGSLVISASDYYGYFTKNPAVADLLKVELQTHTVLFLGYSFSDPDFGMILGKVAAQSGPDRPLLYSLQLNPMELPVKALEKRGIKVLPLPAESGTREASVQVEHWLDCFLQALHRYERRKRQQARVMSPVRDPFAVPKYKHSLIRLRTLRRIEEVLRADFPVIVVKGEAGIGKTQLVATAAANMLVPGGAVVVSDVFEGIIWIRSAGTGTPHTLGHILRTILNSLESFPTTGPSFQEMKDEANRVLEQHRVIVVIEDLEDDDSDDCDDGETARIKNWLEHLGSEAHPRSRIVVTSRSLDLLGFMVEVGRLKPTEARDMVKEHAESIMLRRAIHDGLDEETVKWLARCTLGNPQAIQLALGLVFGTGGIGVTKSVFSELNGKYNEDIESIFDALIDAALDKLKPDAQQVLRAMLVFPDSEPVPAELLKVACGLPAGSDAFSTAADSCARFGLLERDTRHDTFGMHRTSKKLLTIRLNKDREHDRSFDRLADYLRGYLRDERDHNMVCRTDIEEEYWNALVRDQMSKVDPYWPIIKHVMARAGTDSRIVDFVFLLVHYMDSRFLNAERAQFIEAAMTALTEPPLSGDELSNKRLALLKIDALAWTHMENREFEDANKQIDEGLGRIDEKKHPDLVALAEAWRARMESEHNNYEAAYRRLESAAQAAERAGKDWIHMRVKMIWGDVLHRDSKGHETEKAQETQEPAEEPEDDVEAEPDEVKAEKAEKAKKAKAVKAAKAAEKAEKAKKAVATYREAEHLAERYGGEGDGYQTSPRIAFALLERVDNQEAQEEAAQRFRKLVENNQVAAGRLYGQYGNALIAARNNATREAIAQLEAIHREIYHLGKGNVLLSLVENLYRQTVHQRP